MLEGIHTTQRTQLSRTQAIGNCPTLHIKTVKQIVWIEIREAQGYHNIKGCTLGLFRGLGRAQGTNVGNGLEGGRVVLVEARDSCVVSSRSRHTAM